MQNLDRTQVSFNGTSEQNLPGPKTVEASSYSGIHMRLNDKVAIVTGAGQGIGEAIVLRFLAEGAKVVALEWSPELAAALRERLPAGRAVVIEADAAMQDGIDAAIESAVQGFGALHVLVNNAAAYTEKSLVDTTDADWSATLDSALGGMFRFCRAALPVMVAQGAGSIVNLGSTNQIVANPGLAAYTAAKGGVRALSKQIAVEYGPHGVRCNSISPALVLTERTLAGMSDEDLRLNCEAYPLARVGYPEDVAHVALFLASDEAGFVTGVDLPVDGGLTSVAPSALWSPKVRGWWGRAPVELPR
jgi:NAD(P)-dependent dehydrogenase (short-subunit alcohol dehydrogenase family)